MHAPESVFVVMSVGQEMVGFSLSVTVTVKVQVGEPPVLVAVQVTVVMPLGKAKEPLRVGLVVVPMVVGPGMVQVMIGVGQPVAVTVNDSVAVHTPGSVLVVMSPVLHMIVGGMII